MKSHEEDNARGMEQEISDFLLELLKIRSYINNERNLANCCYEAFSGIGGLAVSKIPMDNSIKNHPLYCSGFGNEYNGNFNIEIVLKGIGKKDPIYLNAHMDTVPAAAGNEHLLNPRLKDGIVYGLGACDDKGGIAAMYAVFKKLAVSGVKLPFDVVGHLVVEEEIGGNGTLMVTSRPMKGQSAIVFEPSGDGIFHAHRAGLWIKIQCTGIACHTGSSDAAKSVSALEVALHAIEMLKRVHGDYVQECRQTPVKYYEEYVPFLNLGMINCGDWPGTVPSNGAVMASIGLLPNMTTDEMKKRIADAFYEDEKLKMYTSIEYIFSRDSSVLPHDDALVLDLVEAGKRHAKKLKPVAMKAICDKYFYQELHGIPAVSLGPGRIENAHSAHEQVAVREVLQTADIVTEYIRMKG